jgi:hypothetical protein
MSIGGSAIFPSILARPQPLTETVEAFLPEPTVRLEPFGRVLQRRPAQLRRAELRRAASLDQAGALENPEVLRDRLNRDRKRLRELIDRRLALDEPSKDRAPSGIGECSECGTELIDWQYSSPRLTNHLVEYTVAA